MRLAHWTAWPEAPLVRLSREAMATTQPVRWSARPVTWTALDPSVALVDGDPSVTTTNGSPSQAATMASVTSAVVVSVRAGRGEPGGGGAPVFGGPGGG